MPKYLIERNVPGAGQLGDAERQAMAQHSCDVLRDMPDVRWLESYVTDDKLYCIYVAPNAEAVREHARRGGFPADVVAVVRHVCDPVSAESPVSEAAA